MTSIRQPTKAAMPTSTTARPTRCASFFSSALARSSSYLISWDTSLAAKATRSPSDCSAPAGSGVSLRTIESLSHRVRTTYPRFLTAMGAPASDISSGLAHVRQTPRLALIVIMAARRGGAAEGTGSAVGLVGRDLKLGHWRHETFMPMCGDLPDHSVTIACAEARRNCKRRPWPGRRRGKTHVKPGYQACTFSVIQAGRYRPGLV